MIFSRVETVTMRIEVEANLTRFRIVQSHFHARRHRKYFLSIPGLISAQSSPPHTQV